MTKKLIIEKVISMPLNLREGILYISLENEVVGHLCPCGCGNKILVRIGNAGWKFTEVNGKVTLFPSLGNWNLPCRSHYWIKNNEILWSGDWTNDEIEEGRIVDIDKKRQYFQGLNRSRKKKEIAIIKFFKKFFYRK